MGISTNLGNVAEEIKNKHSAQLQKKNDEVLPLVKKVTVIIVAQNREVKITADAHPIHNTASTPCIGYKMVMAQGKNVKLAST